MPWLTFFATATDLLTFVYRLVFAEGGRAYEAYSRFDHESREFPEIEALTALAEREEPGGMHLGLLLPDVGAPPRIRHNELRPGAVPGHTFRYAIEGCSLLTLQCGRLRRRAQRLVRCDLACAEAGGRAVLAGALEKVRAGATLRDSHAPREQLSVAEG